MGCPNFPQIKDSPKHESKRNHIWNHINILIAQIGWVLRLICHNYVINSHSKMRNPQESRYKLPGVTMGVSNEEIDYGQILKKMPYSYILFYKKNFILITYIKDETIQTMKYATRMFSLIKSLMTTSCLNEYAKTMLNYQSSETFNL